MEPADELRVLELIDQMINDPESLSLGKLQGRDNMKFDDIKSVAIANKV